jgi:hypothetical protein
MNTTRCIRLFSILLLLACGTLPASARGQVEVRVDMTSSGGPIKNLWKMQTVWFYGDDWHDAAEARPDEFIQERFPWLEEIQFMTATGGCFTGHPDCSKDRDLLIDPTRLDAGYDFAPLVRACRNVLQKGLKPFVKTGSVPPAMSSPELVRSTYGTNIRPPADYRIYHDYILACVEELRNAFGLEEVRSWKWGVWTECNHKDWFLSHEGSPATTREEFLKIYDVTVAALEAVIGAEYLFVGFHGIAHGPFKFWDASDLIDHCATGKNHWTGETGTQLDYIGGTFYENRPGVPGDLRHFADHIEPLIDKAQACGFEDCRFGFDEGYFLTGPHARTPWARRLSHNYQVSWDATAFKLACDLDLDWISQWSWSSHRVWGDVDAPVANLARLTHRMTGETRKPLTTSGAPADSLNDIDGLASFDPEDGTLHILLYNHNPEFKATSQEQVTIRISGVTAPGAGPVTVSKWIVDENHSNYWPTWWEERGKKADVGFLDGEQQIGKTSRFDLYAGQELLYEWDREFWQSRIEEYRKLNRLMDPVETEVRPAGGELVLTATLDHHAIAFFEIGGLGDGK